MNKIIKNLLLSIALVILFIVPNVKANTIKSIDMDIYLDKNGTAHVTETWKANLTQGTEGYKPYSDLGISEIKNFTVTDDKGVLYEEVTPWKTSASFSGKAYKNGINKVYNGVELCFGISEYGNRTYTLKYDITDFVTQYTDTQGIYFTFIDMEQYIGSAKVTIYSDTPFSIEENVKIWGYGHKGTTTIEDGKIVIKTEGSLSKYDYISSLIRFESNMFKTNKKVEYSFDGDFDNAMEDISEEDRILDRNDDKEYPVIVYILVFIFVIIMYFALNPFIWIFVILALIVSSNGANHLKLNNFTYEGGKALPNEEELNAFRDIPCDKDLFYAYWVAQQYNISTSKIKEGIIGAILLKWVKEKRITITKTKKGLFSFKDNNYAVDFTINNRPSDELEAKLYDMMEDASGFNKLLEPTEFKKWCSNNHSRVGRWYDSIISSYTDKLKLKNLIVSSTDEVTGIFGRKREVTKWKIIRKVKDEAEHLAGLKKFLNGYTEMKKKDHIEVHVWEEYLMFAELLGVADKVREQFSKLYPNYKDSQLFNSEIDSTYITNIASMAYSGYCSGVARASSYSSGSYSGSSRSSGGGGHSYHSGGHSSSGSHGGGFR